MIIQVIREELFIPNLVREPGEEEVYKDVLSEGVSQPCTGLVLEFEDVSWLQSVPQVWRDRAGALIGLPGFPKHRDDPDPHAPSYLAGSSYDYYDGQTRGALIAVAAAFQALPALRELIHEGQVEFRIVGQNLVKLTWPIEQYHRFVGQAQTA